MRTYEVRLFCLFVSRNDCRGAYKASSAGVSRGLFERLSISAIISSMPAIVRIKIGCAPTVNLHHCLSSRFERELRNVPNRTKRRPGGLLLNYATVVLLDTYFAGFRSAGAPLFDPMTPFFARSAIWSSVQPRLFRISSLFSPNFGARL